MSPSFPSASTFEDFGRVCRDEAALSPGVAALCSRLGLDGVEPQRFKEGTLPVYAIGASNVLKLYAPVYFEEMPRESALLGLLEGRLPIPTPRVLAVGELDGWGYVLMTRLEGEMLASAWPRIERANRERLASELGEALAGLHALRDERMLAARVDWPAFIEEQRRTASERQRPRGLAEHWLEQIPALLASTREPIDGADSASLLHTEIMREHLLVAPTSDGWRFSGLVDFEPSVVGAPEYEFAAVGLFFSAGDSSLLRRVLRAYGYADSALDESLELRLCAYALLHKYSNLSWYLERMPPPKHVTRLEELASLWWGAR